MHAKDASFRCLNQRIYLEESQNPQFIEDLAANLIHAISREVHISLSHFLPAS